MDDIFLSDVSKYSRIIFGLFITFCFVVIAFSTFTYYQLKDNAAQMSINYVNGYTQQVASGIEESIQSKLVSFQTIADSLSHMHNLDNEETLANVLERKNEICQFTFMEYVGSDSTVRVLSGNYPKELNEVVINQFIEPLITNNDRNGYAVSLYHQSLLFAVPVVKDNVTVGVLWGGNAKNEAVDLLNSHVFNETVSALICSDNGEVMISSTDPFTLSLANRMNANHESVAALFNSNDSGVVNYRDEVTNKEYYFSFHRIGYNDWVIVNSLPKGLFSSVKDVFLSRALMAILGVLAMVVGFVILQNIIVKRSNRLFKKMALNDDLTSGLNNNGMKVIYDRIQKEQIQDQYALAMLDVVNFKLINEKYGVSYGDDVLKVTCATIAKRLHRDSNEYVCRSETDHFFVLLHETDNHHLVQRLRTMINDLVYQARLLNKDRSGADIEFKVGVYCIQKEDGDFEAIKGKVILALKQQRKIGHNQVVFFEQSMEDKMHWQQDLLANVDNALKQNQFKVYVQPKVNQSTNQVVGLEALVRWDYPNIGLLSPDQFIPLLEESGHIKLVDRYVFNAVCQWLHQRNIDHKLNVKVSINLSRHHFEDVAFVATFETIVNSLDVDPSLIEFELTERCFMGEEVMHTTLNVVQLMHDIGFSCSMDDFGTGYSSLSLLKSFDFDTIKLDRSFFSDLSNIKNREVLQCIVSLANALNIEVVAEGIETKQQLDELLRLHIDIIQGYYYGKAMPLDEFDQWLNNYYHECNNNHSGKENAQ